MSLGFLVPLLLAGLAAIGVPLAMHLRHRERQRPTRFPSLMFLQRVVIRTAERRRITDWPLLALRSLVVALAVLAFARPVFRGGMAAAVDAAPRTLVIALDRSMSMSRPATWAAARDSATKLLRALRPDDVSALIVFDLDASIAHGLTSDHAAVMSALATARPVSRGTRYASAMRASRQMLDAAGTRVAEVVVITDLQRTGAGGTAGMNLRPGISIRAVHIPGDSANRALASVRADRVVGADRGALVVAASITAHHLAAVQPTAVVLSVNGVERGRRTVAVAPDGVTTVRFEPIAIPPGAAPIVVSMSPDGLAGDDTLHAVVPAEQSHRIMLVTPPGASRDESLYLERALEIGSDPRFEVVRGTSVDAGALPSTGAVLFHDVLPPSTAALDEWVREGGGVIVAGGTRAAASNAGSPLLPGAWRGRVDRSADRGGALGDIALEHPIFEPFRAGAAATLGDPRFLRYPRADPTGDANVLARFDDGAPALLERSVGAGRVVQLAMPLDARNGDFPLQPSFLPFLRRVALHAIGVVDVPLARPTGSGWLPVESVTGLVVRRPGGELVRPEGESAVRLDDAGIYLAYRNQATGSPIAMAAANAPAAESNLGTMAPEELLVGVGEDNDTTLAVASVTVGELESRQRIWQYLLTAVAMLIVAETVMATTGWRGRTRRLTVHSEGGSA